VIAPSAHDLARGGAGGFLEPAIGHCVILALATIVSIVKPFGRTPRGRVGPRARRPVRVRRHASVRAVASCASSVAAA
jgi:hypothetical protein